LYEGIGRKDRLDLLQALLVRHSQLVTTLGATVSQHLAAVLGTHP
jgi:hypothetical protein